MSLVGGLSDRDLSRDQHRQHQDLISSLVPKDFSLFRFPLTIDHPRNSQSVFCRKWVPKMFLLKTGIVQSISKKT